MKKVFIFTTEGKHNRRTGGISVTAQVYQIIGNRPEYVLEVKWNTAAFKGPQSTVMNRLADNGIIPKKYAKGYYLLSNKDIEIFEV